MANEIPGVMRAVVYRGINDLRLEELPMPTISSADILVRIAACGVCPTDIKKIQYGTVLPPRVFGHETAGVIARVGARVRGFRVGERVALHHHVPCLDCRACRHRAFAQCDQFKRTGVTAGFEPAGGGYAEYARVMSFALPGIVKIPRINSFIEGAMLEPVNTVLKAVKRLALLRGDFVAVMGQGPIGLIFTRLLASLGMRVIATDLLESRLKLARQWGARWIFRADDASLPENIHRLTRGHGADAVVVAVPVDAAVVQAQEIVRCAGQVLLFAHTRAGAKTAVDLSSVCVAEKDLIGSYSADFLLQREAAKWVFSRKLDVRRLITHEFPLEQTAAAVELAGRPTPASLKVMVVQQA